MVHIAIMASSYVFFLACLLLCAVPPVSGVQLADWLPSGRPWPNALGFYIHPRAECFGIEHGVHWTRVKRHLWDSLDLRPMHVSTLDAVAQATAAQHALQADSFVSYDVLLQMQAGHVECLCRLGCATMRLLRCVVESSTADCSLHHLDGTIRLVLGLDSDGPSLLELLRSGWPVHRLLTTLFFLSSDTENHERGRRLLQSIEDTAVASFERRPVPHCPELLAALEQTCLYDQPFDTVLCSDSQDTLEAHFSTASVYLGLASGRGTAQHRDFLLQTLERCEGSEHLCAAANMDSNMEDDISQASGLLSRAFAESSLKFVMDQLLAVQWPIVEQLHQIAAATSMKDARRGQQFASQQMGSAASSFLNGPCGCSLSAWRAEDAYSVAAALRVLHRLRAVEGDVTLIIAEAQSDDALTACTKPTSRNMSDNSGFKDVADSVVGKVWGLESVFEGATQDSVLRVAEWLRNSDSADFDVGVCVPGTMAVELVCSLVLLEQNLFETAVELQAQSTVLSMSIIPCIFPVSGELLEEHAEARSLFMADWNALAYWLEPPQRFLDKVWEPLLASDRWWRGELTRSGQKPEPQFMPESATACFGVMGHDAEHPCRSAVRGGDPGGGVFRSPAALPLTRVLGVGSMKAGSTAVWQALGAATQLPMGLDCDWIAHTDVVARVTRRVAPLAEILEKCSEELFKWELAKDPALTSLASRFEEAWPAISAHGEKLRIYMVVRNPFSFVRSFVRHLFVRLNPDFDAQHFSIQNLPKPSRFTRMKQLYLDVGRAGLQYSGYVDAAVQRWALDVDEYIRCPTRFAVLMRYEDFVAEPVWAVQYLVQELGLVEHWSEASAGRVLDAVGVRYQPQSGTETSDWDDIFGPKLYGRIRAAVAERAMILGYGHLLGSGEVEYEVEQPIDMPPLPLTTDCHL